MSTTKVRSSNIELLKIIAIFMIIISHFTQTYGQFQSLDYSTDRVQVFLLALMRYFGSIGNFLFFICSAWFFIDSEKNNKKKLLAMLLNVWLVSVVIMLLVMVLGKVNLSGSEIMKCLLPTTFSNNWYVTCYLLFCLLYPAINVLLSKISDRSLLSFLLVSFFLLFFLAPLTKEWEGGNFYNSQLVTWILIYCLLYYLKKYSPQVLESRRLNTLVLLISLLGFIGLPMAVNVLGKRIAFFEGRLQFFNSIDNIFLVLLAISTFNLFRGLKLQSRFINRVSACTLYIYIIHENILLRRHYRPMLFQHIESVYGFQHVLLWILILAFATLIISTLFAIIYQKTLQIAVNKVVERCYPKLQNKWNHGLDRIQKRLREI